MLLRIAISNRSGNRLNPYAIGSHSQRNMYTVQISTHGALPLQMEDQSNLLQHPFGQRSGQSLSGSALISINTSTLISTTTTKYLYLMLLRNITARPGDRAPIWMIIGTTNIIAFKYLLFVLRICKIVGQDQRDHGICNC